MQKFTQKYTIISLLEYKAEGYEYDASDWPLHVTIADTFAIDWGIHKLIEKLSGLSSNTKTLNSPVSHEEFFGSRGQVHVVILEMGDELIKLHFDVVALLKEANVIFNDSQYSEDGFKAHSTVQKHARLNIGDNVVFDNLALVDMFPNKDPHRRKILKICKFKK